MSINGNYKFQYPNKFNNINYNNQSNDSIHTSTIILSNNTEDIDAIQRKIEYITKYLKPYILKTLNDVLQNNPVNAKTIWEYIIAEQNGINIKESTKEMKIKKMLTSPHIESFTLRSFIPYVILIHEIT